MIKRSSRSTHAAIAEVAEPKTGATRKLSAAAAEKRREIRVRAPPLPRIELQSLALPGPGSGGALPVPVEDSDVSAADKRLAIEYLQGAGLTLREIESLQRELERERGIHLAQAALPTRGEDKKVVAAIAQVLHALDSLLRNASPEAKASFARAIPPELSVLASSVLSTAAEAVAREAEDMPSQSRHAPRVGIIEALHKVAGHRLPPLSTGQESPYYYACEAAFKLADLDSSPLKAIMRFKTSKAARHR
jgi:hypothetical protein